MPRKQTTAKKSSLPIRSLRLGRQNLAILAAFVLVFVGLGTVYISHSEAATSYCVQHQYYEYADWGSQCVRNIQTELKNLYWVTNGNLTVDGDFGPDTKAAVIRFGYGTFGANNNGVVGYRTWLQLCDAALSVSPSVGASDGCGKVPTSTYGEYGP